MSGGRWGGSRLHSTQVKNLNFTKFTLNSILLVVHYLHWHWKLYSNYLMGFFWDFFYCMSKYIPIISLLLYWKKKTSLLEEIMMLQFTSWSKKRNSLLLSTADVLSMFLLMLFLLLSNFHLILYKISFLPFPYWRSKCLPEFLTNFK